MLGDLLSVILLFPIALENAVSSKLGDCVSASTYDM